MSGLNTLLSWFPSSPVSAPEAVPEPTPDPEVVREPPFS